MAHPAAGAGGPSINLENAIASETIPGNDMTKEEYALLFEALGVGSRSAPPTPTIASLRKDATGNRTPSASPSSRRHIAAALPRRKNTEIFLDQNAAPVASKMVMNVCITGGISRCSKIFADG